MRGLIKSITGANSQDLRRAAIISVLVAFGTAVLPAAAFASSAINVNLGTGAGLSERVVQMVGLLTVLSLAPSIVIMTTSFVRIVVVLGLLRTAIGVQQSPPNPVIISLALFLTAIVMGPTFERSYDLGVKPLLDKQMELPEAFEAAGGPVKEFMLKQTRQADLAMFAKLARAEHMKCPEQISLRILLPSFVISELKTAFQIGFTIFIPFLIVDLVVASVLMSMGMMMVPPATISLPFKLMLFVLVDGWQLLMGALAQSFFS